MLKSYYRGTREDFKASEEFEIRVILSFTLFRFMKKKIYYDYSKVDGYSAPIKIVVGPRGVGKTFGKKRKAIEKMITNTRRFIYVVESGEDIKKLTMNGGEKFFSDILEVYEKGESSRDRYFAKKLISTEVEGEVDEKLFKKTGATKIAGGTLKVNGETAGYILDLNSFGNLKRNAFTNISTVLIDEFMSEKFDKTTLELPRKIVSLVETVARTKDMQIYMLGNTVRHDDPVLARMGFRLKKYGIYKIYDEFGLLAVLDFVNPDDYPEYKEKHARSVAGRLAKLMGEDNENSNEFKSDLPDSKRLTTFRYKKCGWSANIVKDDVIITLKELTNGNIACVPFARRPTEQLYCLTEKEQGYKLGYHIVCNPYMRQMLQDMLRADIIYYYSEVEYLQLKTILKGA